MSNLGSIHTYRSEVDRIIRYGGSSKETSIRPPVFSPINAHTPLPAKTAKARHDPPPAYVAFEHPEVRESKNAVERYKRAPPNIVHTLRGMIQQQAKATPPSRVRRNPSPELCRPAINPAVT